MKMFSRKNRKGFTLIELIIVIAILAILAAIAIPSFIGITDNANATVEIANARTIATAVNAHNNLSFSDSTKYPMISSKPADVATLKGTLKNLWPSSLSDADASKAFGRITITNGVATVNTSTSTGTGTGTGTGS